MLQAIDEQPVGSYDVSEALEGLSILDDSFLDKFAAGTNSAGGLDNLCNVRAPQAQPPSPRASCNVRQSGSHDHAALCSPPATNLSVPSDDGELWQSLLLEQKIRYEEQIQKLTRELLQMRRLVQDSQTSGDNGSCSGERDKWTRITHILDSYFAEYNVQF